MNLSKYLYRKPLQEIPEKENYLESLCNFLQNS